MIALVIVAIKGVRLENINMYLVFNAKMNEYQNQLIHYYRVPYCVRVGIDG